MRLKQSARLKRSRKPNPSNQSKLRNRLTLPLLLPPLPLRLRLLLRPLLHRADSFLMNSIVCFLRLFFCTLSAFHSFRVCFVLPLLPFRYSARSTPANTAPANTANTAAPPSLFFKYRRTLFPLRFLALVFGLDQASATCSATQLRH